MNIKELKNRDGRGYNQLARDAGLSPSVVWRVINKKTPRPSMHTLAKIARVFGVSVDTLIKSIGDGN